ncbi:protein transport protein Sec16B isoform X5 [Tribolium castaneum]|uniref:protein transport protein Sec16B isoform X5 n=1 Tax=Tribolium castaneum TaxID=7070 RepID=UPI00077DEAC7|nr:PREDICTED: protein transport protein Sec16A isoform X5 [Tribolium castaneum]|eukprot:XP_015839573.1 PREDICTED: protein transport protein Sec16A isoform X5 [Tribolium castaneum]
MSWVKKRGQPANAGAPPQVPMYNPNQHSNQENHWQQNYYNTYQQQQQPYNMQYNQQYTQNNFEGAQSEDTWGSNWGWGDEDNSNTQAPNIAESFAKDETWNWNLEEAKPPEAPLTGKRNKLDTPQWSVESQMSQESSDDVLQTSESDKSRGGEAGGPHVENKEILSPKPTKFPTLSVNLESPPDNSEQPDKTPPPPRFENNEAPINDRNQYLETAQLSDVDFARVPESHPIDDVQPPPGLRRMVGGAESSEPPEGLRRMIPGESSSPEARSAERSETIGADSVDTTPPKVDDLVSSVRNLSVEDETNEVSGGRRHSRESSESEHERRSKSPRRDRRKDERERERNRGRYSPDRRDKRRYKGRYEEESDYYSDKEKDRRHERDYDRKYSSLRKEKDKDRRRRDYDSRPRKDYYYGRYEDEFENESRSRASSRSDSMHESYRERGHDRRDRRHKERERHKRRMDPFNPYNQAFGFDIYNQYYQQYHYYENLRKTNPQAYAQLYRKYYQEASGETPYGTEDRASVHSGRSSANDELVKDSFVRTLDQTDTSLNYEDPNLTAQRLTPAKFATAHIKASISCGKMVKILPHYPLDGQAPTVELCSLENFLYNDEDYQELKRFPGPLVKGTTHKKTIIEYCENKIKSCAFNHYIGDKESYILMWELLILLIRQNGMVVGADIAELLLKNRTQDGVQRAPSVISSVGSNTVESETKENQPIAVLKEEEITNKFRDYLLYGSVKEALEWAMKHGLWGHALFLASKLDKRTYANVLMRFANGLAMNDPLQTLYQLLSGRTPAAVTCVADEKWGDWRPHLAMILSNSTQRPEVNCKAITVLGDTLMGRGSLYAAQFCYLMAEVGFGRYDCAESKLVLLGANHNHTFGKFATNEAIHMTEIYEYARSLNDDDFALVNFQRFKYLLATRLADVGLLEKSLSYLEKIAIFIVKNPTSVETGLVDDVARLADRLKHYDPVGVGDGDFDTSRLDNSWLEDLRRVQNDLNMGVISQQNVSSSTLPTQNEQIYTQNQDTWQQQQQQQYDQYQQQQWNPEPVEPPVQPETNENYNNYQEQQQYWAGQQQWNEQPVLQETVEQQQQNYYGAAHNEPEQVEKPSPDDIPQPQISLPNQQPQKTEPTAEPKKEVVTKPKTTEPVQDKQSGWFGGIFNKLTLKPKNQMKLPDDKNPTILWDSEKKRWVNTDEDNGDGGNDFKPPPKMAEMAPVQPTFHQQVQKVEPMQENGNVAKPPQPAQANMFKLQKNRNIKKSYIDVFNPGKPGPAAAPAPLGGAPQAQPPMNFFIPQPVNDPNAPTDFLTPAPPLQFNNDTQMSRWSSASSLSREVQSYTMHKPIRR